MKGKLSGNGLLAVQPAPLHYHSLQRLKHQALKLGMSHDKQILIFSEARQDLEL